MKDLLEDPLFWRVVMTALIPLLFYCGFRAWKRARLIGDLPTSRVRSAAQGYIELMGRAKLTDGTAMVAPLTRRPCVWWNYQVQRRRQYGKRTEWETVDRGVSTTPFLLEDESGWCIVNPLGAEVFPVEKASWRGNSAWPAGAIDKLGDGIFSARLGEYRYTEYRIAEHELVNGIGEFHTVGGVQAVETTHEVIKVLGEWKRDRPELMRRFDADRNGVLSLDEWEAARAAARAQVQSLAFAEVPADYCVLSKPADGRPFLLASGDLERIAKRYRWQAGAALLGFVVLCGLLTAQLAS